MGTRIGLLKIPMLNLVLCLVLYTCFAFYCISAVLCDRCCFCCSVLTATVINEHYYYYYFLNPGTSFPRCETLLLLLPTISIVACPSPTVSTPPATVLLDRSLLSPVHHVVSVRQIPVRERTHSYRSFTSLTQICSTLTTLYRLKTWSRSLLFKNT